MLAPSLLIVKYYLLNPGGDDADAAEGVYKATDNDDHDEDDPCCGYSLSLVQLFIKTVLLISRIVSVKKSIQLDQPTLGMKTSIDGHYKLISIENVFSNRKPRSCVVLNDNYPLVE